MLKDYITIHPNEQPLDDLQFVDQYWTDRWQEAGLTQIEARLVHLTKRQEYRLMRPYLDQLPPGARLLDAGCGRGEWSLFLSNQGFETVGMDISEPTIAALQTRFPELTFVCGDIRDMDFPAAHFDGCFSWGAFEHFETGLQSCIRETLRVLKPGGYLFITVPFHNLRQFWHQLKSWNRWDTASTALWQNGGRRQPASVRFYQWRLTRAELARELIIGGFTVLDIQPVQHLEGIKRTLKHDLKFETGTRAHRMGVRLLRRLPATLVAHMIMAVAQKPAV